MVSVMKNFSRLFVIEDGNCGGWTESKRTSFVISVEGDYLTVRGKSGRDMYTAEVNTAFGRFLQEYEEEFGEKIALYERKNRYRFCYREGSSGCQDTFIEIDKGDGFPDRKFIMHESCFGKTAGFSCFVYDFLDLCVAGEFLAVEDGEYVYHEEEDANSGLVTKIVRPRLLEYEDGWTEPWERPSGVVQMEICRYAPEPEPEESETAETDPSEQNEVGIE